MRFDRIRDHRPLRTGHSVGDGRVRFGNYFHLMREIVHLHNGWIARVPSFDVKALLGIHVYEDATFVRRIRQRLQELETPGTYPAAPGDGVNTIIETLNGYETWEEYVATIYSVIKPGLMDAWEAHFTSGDPLLDEPSQRLIARFMQITAQHISGGMGLLESLYQLDPEKVSRLQDASAMMRVFWGALGNDFGTSPLAIGKKHTPAPRGTVTTPARESFIKVEHNGATDPFAIAVEKLLKLPDGHDFLEGIKKSLHGQLNSQITCAEIYALSSHENPLLPWEFHEAFCRLVWDKIRHAQAIDKLLGSLGSGWGAEPINMSEFTSVYTLPLRQRLQHISKQKDIDHVRAAGMAIALKERNQPYLANLVDHLVAETDYHRRACTTWAGQLERLAARTP